MSAQASLSEHQPQPNPSYATARTPRPLVSAHPSSSYGREPAARRAGLPKSAARSRHWRTRGARESDCILAANAEHDRTRQTERQTVEGNANNMDVQSEGGTGFGLWFACAQRGRVPGSIPGDISRVDVAPLTPCPGMWCGANEPSSRACGGVETHPLH